MATKLALDDPFYKEHASKLLLVPAGMDYTLRSEEHQAIDRLSPYIDFKDKTILLSSGDPEETFIPLAGLGQSILKHSNAKSVTLGANEKYINWASVFAGRLNTINLNTVKQEKLNSFDIRINLSLFPFKRECPTTSGFIRAGKFTGWEGPITKPTIDIDLGSIKRVSDKLHKSFGLKTNRKLAVIHPAFDPLLNWGRRKWIDVSESLAQQNWNVVWVEVLSMDYGYNRMRNDSKYYAVKWYSDLIPKEIAALVDMSDLVISPSSIMLHLAGCLNKKVIGLWGNQAPPKGLNEEYPTHIEVNGDAHCAPCNKTVLADHCPWMFQGKSPLCLDNIAVKDVIKHVDETYPIHSHPPFKIEGDLKLKNSGLNVIVVQRHFGENYFGGSYYTTDLIRALLENDNTSVTLYVDQEPISANDHGLLNHPNVSIVHDPSLAGYQSFPANLFDLAITMPFDSTEVGLYWKTKHDLPVIACVYETHNYIEETAKAHKTFGLPSLGQRHFEEFRYNLTKVDHIFTLCDYIADKTLQWDLRISPQQVTAVSPSPNMGVISKFDPINLRDRAHEVVAISRYTPYKRYDLLARAMRALPEEDRPLLTMVGMGLQKAQEEGLFLGLQHQVFDGISDVKKFEILTRAKVLVHASDFEGFGLPPLEAMACGTPVICSNIPILQSIYGDAAIYFERGDHRSLRNKLIALLNDLDLQEELAERGKKIVFKHSPEQMRENIFAAINKVQDLRRN